MAELLAAIGDDPAREGLLDTPDRVARMYQGLFSGIGVKTDDAIDTVFEAESQDPVVVRGLAFYSMCEHHLLPFFGKAHVAYIPNGSVMGLSKVARLVEVFARRFQVQERLTEQIAQAVLEVSEARGVAVVIEAHHLCMMMRGVQKQNSKTITSAMLGLFREDHRTRDEFLRLTTSVHEPL